MLRNYFLSSLTGLLGSLTLISSVIGIANPANAALGFNRAATNPTDFHNIINDFQAFVNVEQKKVGSEIVGARKLDNSKLNLKYNADLTFYFINEGAGYRNQLGFTSSGTTPTGPTILFEDIACTKGCALNGYREPNLAFGTPDGKALAIGDYYDVGTLQAGTSFDFFLRQDGYNRPNAKVWHTLTSQNSDNLQHLMAYDYKDYLVLAFEDLTGGGDKDYNDVIVVVDIKKENIDAIPSAATPEPTEWAGIGLAVLLGWRLKRLQKSQSIKSSEED